MKRACFAVAVAVLALPSLAAAQEARGGRAARVREALDRMEAEPSIQDVHRAALRYFRVNPSAVESLRRASVRRAAAPTITLSGRYERVESDRDVRDQMAAIETDDRFGSNVFGGSVELRWDLPGTVFSPAQLQTYALVGIQMNLLKEVTRLFYVRRQLMLSLLTEPPEDPRARVAMEMRVEEFTSLIDSFTGGWYSERLARSTR